MADNTTKQIAELNRKVDTILEYVNQQRLKSEAVDDLVADASIIGKDMYDATVRALDDHEVVIDPNQLRELGIRIAQNIGNFNSMLDALGSALDLMRDAGPVANEMAIDATKKLHEFEQKGYFDFLRELGRMMDNIVSHYSVEDMRLLADNAVVIIDTLKNLTQPEILKSVDSAVNVFVSLEDEDIPQYSLFRVMREMNSPEMKRTLGFFITFMKNLSKNKIH